jgi:hypothetical protein
MSSDVRKKFGLDYLISTNKPGVSGDYDSKINEVNKALFTVGGNVLSVLKSEPRYSIRLHGLVDKSGFDLETLLRVVNYLEALGLIRYADRDKLGNHEVVLTEAGLETVSE